MTRGIYLVYNKSSDIKSVYSLYCYLVDDTSYRCRIHPEGHSTAFLHTVDSNVMGYLLKYCTHKGYIYSPTMNNISVAIDSTSITVSDIINRYNRMIDDITSHMSIYGTVDVHHMDPFLKSLSDRERRFSPISLYRLYMVWCMDNMVKDVHTFDSFLKAL